MPPSRLETTRHAKKQLMPIRVAARLYCKGLAWFSLLLMLAFLGGYKDAISAARFAFPAFKWMYGDLVVENHTTGNGTVSLEDKQQLLQLAAEHAVSPSWQAAVSIADGIGGLFGLLATGVLIDRFGFRIVLTVSLLLTCGLMSLQMYASTIGIFFGSEVLIGIPWAICQSITMTYPMEILPTELRGLAGSMIMLATTFGDILGYGVFKVMNQWFERRQQGLHNTFGWAPEWAFRLPLAMQLALAVPVLLGGLFMPESPWWLVKRDRRVDAVKSLERLRSYSYVAQHCYTSTAQAVTIDSSTLKPLPSVVETLMEINETDLQQRANESGTRYVDAFRGAVSRRRTEIAVLVLLAPTFCGSAMGRWSTVFLEGSTSLSAGDSFSASIVRHAVGVPGLILSFHLIAHVGRRKLLLCGLAANVLIACAIGTIGFIDVAQHQPSGNSSSVAETTWPALYTTCFIFFKLIAVACVGPSVISLLVEIPAVRLRQKTVAISRLIRLVITSAESALIPYMFLGAREHDTVSLKGEEHRKDKQGAWGWGARAAFLYVGLGCASIAWCWFRLPEPKDKSFRELDDLFEKGTRARDFKKKKSTDEEA